MILKDYTFEQIEKDKKYKKIVFFGGGEFFDLMRREWSSRLQAERILCIADNNNSKQGLYLRWGDRNIPIVSIEECVNRRDINLIIISASDGYGIYCQLEKYDQLSETECCYCKFMLAKETARRETSRIYPKSFRRTQKPLIPHVIHYCWFGNNPLPDRYQEWMESWKKYCPEYKIILWDESNYDISWSSYMVEAYEQKKWGFVPDVARMDIIYRYGGIYLDTDVELVRSLDELCYQKSFFGVEGSGLVAPGLGFGAEKGHWFIKKLMGLYQNRHFLKENGDMDLTTSPKIQAEGFREIGFPFDGNAFYTRDISIYPEWVLSPKNIYSVRIHTLEHSSSTHHFDGSWMELTMSEKWNADEKLREQIVK